MFWFILSLTDYNNYLICFQTQFIDFLSSKIGFLDSKFNFNIEIRVIELIALPKFIRILISLLFF